MSTQETTNETLIPLTKALGNPVHGLSFLSVRSLPLPLHPRSPGSLCEASATVLTFVCLSTRLFAQPLQPTGPSTQLGTRTLTDVQGLGQVLPLQQEKHDKAGRKDRGGNMQDARVTVGRASAK